MTNVESPEVGNYAAKRLYEIAEFIVERGLIMVDKSDFVISKKPESEWQYGYWLWSEGADRKPQITPSGAVSRLAIRAVMVYSPRPQRQYRGIYEVGYYTESGGSGIAFKLNGSRSLPTDGLIDDMYADFGSYFRGRSQFVVKKGKAYARQLEQASDIFNETQLGAPQFEKADGELITGCTGLTLQELGLDLTGATVGSDAAP